MERILCAELAHVPPGTSVLLQGHVHRRRRLSAVTFLVLRDRSGLAQVVLRGAVESPGEETVVEVVGTAAATASAPGGVEVVDPTVAVLAEPEGRLPVELWRPELGVALPTQLDHAALTWRHPAQRARWEVAAAALRGFRTTLDGLGFTEIATPKVVGTATESGANVFGVDWFGTPAYLAQSPQFFKQTMVGAFERVYEVGPVFRAEPHDTVRHLAEYVSLDVELGFVRDHRDVLAVLREVLAGMVGAVGERPGIALPTVPEELPVIHFADALALVGAPPDEPDLAPAHERALGEWALAEHGSELLAVEGYPMAKRPFYTHPQPDDAQPDEPRWSASFDVLFRGVELVTGGQRLHRYADYLAALEARGEDPAAYEGYLAAFRHGMPPHGGFAIGLERFVAQLVGARNVREVTLFPRDLHRLSP